MQRYKLVVTVPEAQADELRSAIGKAGGGKIGNYAYCSFSVKGKGRFIPLDGASPAIGDIGKPEIVIEERIEINCDETNVQAIMRRIREVHPYEEPAIDVYPLCSELS